jgi:hypothetical protein
VSKDCLHQEEQSMKDCTSQIVWRSANASALTCHVMSCNVCRLTSMSVKTISAVIEALIPNLSSTFWPSVNPGVPFSTGKYFKSKM